MTEAATRVGSLAYTLEAAWPHLPPDTTIGDVGGVAVDSGDNVYVFNRGPHPMLVFDRSGAFVRSWGHGVFTRPHGIHIAPDGDLWLTDDGDHTVRCCTPRGVVKRVFGVPGRPSPVMSGRPFNRCTHTASAPNGDILVSDGYRNAAVHRFDLSGRHLGSWGKSGVGPGEFNVPHNICCDVDGWVYVADRENHRIQVFDKAGRYETSWHDLHRPCALCMRQARETTFYVGEVPPGLGVNRGFPNLGASVALLNRDGAVLGRIGEALPGIGPGQFTAPHGMAVDSHGDLYVGEVANAAWRDIGEGDPPAALRTLRKLVCVESP